MVVFTVHLLASLFSSIGSKVFADDHDAIQQKYRSDDSSELDSEMGKVVLGATWCWPMRVRL